MTSPTDYLLRIAADEIEHFESEGPNKFPHLARLIDRPGPRFVLRHLQNFCWTTERLWCRLMSRPLPAQAVQPQRFRPAMPAAASGTAQTARVWIDVTNTFRTGFGGGIGRVAMRLAKAGIETGLALPVVIENGRVRPYFRLPNGADELQFDASVTYVLVDSFWQQMDEYVAVCETAKAAGAKIVTCIHDVIPLYYPNFNRRRFAEHFAKCFSQMMKQSDACVAVSRYTSDKVQTFIEAFGLRPDRDLPLATFKLGADGHVDQDPKPIRDKIRVLFTQPKVFLSVGTIEPRKGYPITLDAFDSLWRQGVACSFVIIGRAGWISKALEKRILEHPLYGKRLHWLADVEDSELTFAYRHAYCLIQASITEGFGLPIVEANHEGVPVIAADTDVFRELAGTSVTYFQNCDSVDLAAKIEDAVRQRPPVHRFDIPTWRDSLIQMIEAMEMALEQRSPALPEPASARPESAGTVRRAGAAALRTRRPPLSPSYVRYR